MLMENKEYFMGITGYSPDEVLSLLESDDLKEKFSDLVSLGCDVRTLQFEENGVVHVDFNVIARNMTGQSSEITPVICGGSTTLDKAVERAYDSVISLGKECKKGFTLVAQEARYKGQDIACFRYNGRRKVKFGL